MSSSTHHDKRLDKDGDVEDRANDSTGKLQGESIHAVGPQRFEALPARRWPEAACKDLQKEEAHCPEGNQNNLDPVGNIEGGPFRTACKRKSANDKYLSLLFSPC